MITIQIRPEDPSVPIVDIPGNIGVSGFAPNHFNFHYYDVRSTAQLNPCRVIDNLVLIGSPIDANFLRLLQQNPNIGSVNVVNFTDKGDRICAGMSELELVAAVPNLVCDVGSDRGHFYYGGDNPTGEQRRDDLAQSLFQGGVR